MLSIRNERFIQTVVPAMDLCRDNCLNINLFRPTQNEDEEDFITKRTPRNKNKFRSSRNISEKQD